MGMRVTPRKPPARRRVAEEPLTAFELVTRRAVEYLERELGRIDAKSTRWSSG